ncbi:hypothetical protein SSS_10917 [Sarcoptes scabiei]|nr:hypothetical protein SSS_10917 [Sarcoptes scabiei]
MMSSECEFKNQDNLVNHQVTINNPIESSDVLKIENIEERTDDVNRDSKVEKGSNMICLNKGDLSSENVSDSSSLEAESATFNDDSDQDHQNHSFKMNLNLQIKLLMMTMKLKMKMKKLQLSLSLICLQNEIRLKIYTKQIPDRLAHSESIIFSNHQMLVMRLIHLKRIQFMEKNMRIWKSSQKTVMN